MKQKKRMKEGTVASNGSTPPGEQEHSLGSEETTSVR